MLFNFVLSVEILLGIPWANVLFKWVKSEAWEYGKGFEDVASEFSLEIMNYRARNQDIGWRAW